MLSKTLMVAKEAQLPIHMCLFNVLFNSLSGNVQEAKDACSIILLNGFVEALSNSLKETSIQEIQVVNIDPAVTCAILDRLKSKAFQNIYQYLGQTHVYLVKQGINPFAPNQFSGITQPQSGNVQSMNLGNLNKNFSSKPFATYQGSPQTQSGFNVCK